MGTDLLSHKADLKLHQEIYDNSTLNYISIDKLICNIQSSYIKYYSQLFLLAETYG